MLLLVYLTTLKTKLQVKRQRSCCSLMIDLPVLVRGVLCAVSLSSLKQWFLRINRVTKKYESRLARGGVKTENCLQGKNSKIIAVSSPKAICDRSMRDATSATENEMQWQAHSQHPASYRTADGWGIRTY